MVITFDVLITKAEQLQGITENANEIPASKTTLAALKTQLVDAHRQIKAMNGASQTIKNFRGRGIGRSGSQ
jgi:hypothetical protein